MRSYKRTVFLPDIHVPFEDEAALSAAIAFVDHVKPHVVVQLGDLLDFYPLSRFDKNPMRRLQLQLEFDRAAEILGRIRAAAPDARIVVLQGNHEARLKKYLWSKAPELSPVRNMEVQALLDVKASGVEYVESGCTDLSPQLMVKHGHVVRGRSGYSATGELERQWKSGVSGHTHRMGQVYRRSAGGEFTWVEAGCLCQLDAEYMEGQTADWQHGLVYGEVARDRYWVGMHPILSGKIVWGGVEIKGNGGRRARAKG